MGIALFKDNIYGFGGGGLGTTDATTYSFYDDAW